MTNIIQIFVKFLDFVLNLEKVFYHPALSLKLDSNFSEIIIILYNSSQKNVHINLIQDLMQFHGKSHIEDIIFLDH